MFFHLTDDTPVAVWPQAAARSHPGPPSMQDSIGEVLTTFPLNENDSGAPIAFSILSPRDHHGGETNHLEDAGIMTLQRHFKRMVIDVLDDGTHLLHMGEMEIWDGADLSLLREGFTQLIERDGIRSIIIDMHFVKYIPSGFFGMLFDWHEKRNVWFALTLPQPNVQRMLWFQQFFRRTEDGCYELWSEGRDLFTPAGIGAEPVLIEGQA